MVIVEDRVDLCLLMCTNLYGIWPLCDMYCKYSYVKEVENKWVHMYISRYVRRPILRQTLIQKTVLVVIQSKQWDKSMLN